MEDSVKVILKKLDDIDSRLRSIEGVKTSSSFSPALRVPEVKETKIERDPLFGKALEIMDKLDEMSSRQLQEALKIDTKRADSILDQLETAGLGTCYMREV
jgi:predicted RND superfamily exporter protein